jgi:hypothetical protein
VKTKKHLRTNKIEHTINAKDYLFCIPKDCSIYDFSKLEEEFIKIGINFVFV